MKNKSKKSGWKQFKRNIPLHLMLLPAVILVLIFAYIPMYGLVIAFQNFNAAKGIFGGQKWIGLGNFTYIFTLPSIWRVFGNTLIIAVLKIIFGTLAAITTALLLNECSAKGVKKGVQTMIYFPHFISWIILAGVFTDILSPTDGVVNSFLGLFGVKPIYFLGDNKYFRGTLVVTDIWKSFGYNSIVYLATITGIDPSLYEAASIDGAGRWKQMWHITLPGMSTIIILLTILSMGNILNAGFDQVFNLYSAAVYDTGDIIDTLVYRLGLQGAKFGPSTAVGLLKSIISLVLISSAYLIAWKKFDYTVF